MKALKKLVSLVLTAAIMLTTVCVGTVTASAESDSSVKFYNDDDYYYVRVSGIDEDDYDAAFKNSTKTLLPYVCVAYVIDDVKYGFGNMQYKSISVDAFVADDNDVDMGLKGYYKYNSKSETYSFYFRMPKTNKNAKKYMGLVDEVDFCGVFFGLFDATTKKMYDPYKKNFDMDFVEPVIAFDGSSSSAKKISSLEFDGVNNYTYTGKARKPAVTIYDGSYKLVKGTDYTLSYKNNKEIGEATITVKGKGNYTGSKTINFNVVPKKPTIKVTEKSGKITVSWNEIDGAEKYQIYYSVNGGKYKKLAATSKTKYTTSKLDTDDELKFRVRAYAEVDDENYYGSFSKAVELA